MDVIKYKPNHDLGYFDIFNPEYRCLGMLGHLAIFVSSEPMIDLSNCDEDVSQCAADHFRQYEIIDTNTVYKDNYTQMKRVLEIECTKELFGNNGPTLTINSRRGAWSVSMVRVDVAYSGFGLAPEIYRWLMINHNMVFQAGDEQSPGGKSIWYKLSCMDDVIVYGKSFNSDLVRCDPDHDLCEIVAEDGTIVYDPRDPIDVPPEDEFAAFACYSP